MCKPVSFLLLMVGCLLLLSGSIHAQFSISINYPPALADTAITRLAITDVTQLLQQACQCPVTHNEPAAADVSINLPDINPSAANQPTAFALRAGFPYKHYPAHHFSWQQTVLNNSKQTNLTLSATTLQGVSFGLYALLQELLGFAFYHPKQTYVPNLKEWTLIGNFTWSGAPLFDKKGFHLHTQHPIELTEPLLNPNYPNALEEVKTYINWLTRNGQNYFEFCLLNSIDRPLWIKHAQQICHYAHSRGIFIAVDVSLHMIQQKTFQLYEEPLRKKQQITQNLQWLMQAPWDFINMEFSTAEFIPGNTQKKEQLRLFIITWLQANAPNTKLMGRQHVVQEKQPDATRPILPDSATIATDRQRGILAHTVMFYDMTEPNAPVYQNQNQQHMYRFMLQQHQIRETWYYPESAYWITFDNSVPMLLLPYLQARLADIDTCVAHQIPGHITFSSGWEWSYWLIDWSIARWSWQYALNNIPQKRYPEMYAHKLPAKNAELAFTLLLQLQQQYLKDSSLMQWMTAMTVTDEIPIKALANAYHPRPATSYPFLRNKATATQLQAVQNTVIPQLDNFASSALQLVQVMNNAHNHHPDTLITHLKQELADGLHITALRAMHRAQILRYLTAHRQAKLNQTPFTGHSYLQQAANIRQQALQIVKRRENHYRYPLPLLTHKQPDHTAYHFGYLYPVTNLHFWHREEQQAKQNQYHPAFMNIWQVGRIIGLKK